jgi:hypothetical protein
VPSHVTEWPVDAGGSSPRGSESVPRRPWTEADGLPLSRHAARAGSWHRHARRVTCAALLILSAAGMVSAADERDPLARARALYNARDFEGAIAAANEGRRLPTRANSADLIAARALLERYRESASVDDLGQARERLRGIDPEQFGPVERLEYIVGLGQTLFYDSAAGAAADVFESVLGASASMAFDARERVLDWWASAIDREARPQPDIERQALYQKVLDRMRMELARNPASSVAAYWLSAAARGQGDLRGAWDAAQAGWVRAPLTADHGATLRADLDRLVQRGIVPDRARLLAQSPDTLLKEWERFKEQWERRDD